MSIIILDRADHNDRWAAIGDKNDSQVVIVRDEETFDIVKNLWGFIANGLPLDVLSQLIDHPIKFTNQDESFLIMPLRKDDVLPDSFRKLEPEL